MSGSTLFVLNLISTWYMVGLIWLVQAVHYKMFDRVGEAQFQRYEADHNRLITPIVGVPMLVEAATAAGLLYAKPDPFPNWAAWAGIAMLVAIWLSTALLQIPCHSRLMNGFDQQAHQRLVRTNWIRTLFWTARGGLLAYFAVAAMGT